MRYEILHEGKVVKTFENETNDFPALSWLQRNQSHSFDWARRYEGWQIFAIDTETEEIQELK